MSMLAVLAVVGVGARLLGVGRGESKLTQKWDPVFKANCPGIPVAFVRALCKNESNFNPSREHLTGSKATGLLQVAQVVREGYNDRHGTSVEHADLFDPEVNVRIACDLIARIAKGYQDNHPSLKVNWGSRRWVELLVYGWNAGYSQAAGVGYVVGQLEARGYPSWSITIELVHQAAFELPKASTQLHNPAKVAWCKKVAATYLAER